MKTIENTIALPKELILSIKEKANKSGFTFEEMIRLLYCVISPNNCILFYQDKNGKYFRKVNGVKKSIMPEEFALYSKLNQDSQVILMKRVSLLPIAERI